MKDYEKYVLWLDYFNSELKRSQGRRIPVSAATKAPLLAELEEACRKLNMQPMAQSARYPGTPLKQSGYVSVKKVRPKHALLLKVAKELSSVRGQALRRQAQSQPGRKK